MFEERAERLHRLTVLLDMALTVMAFLSVAWLREAHLDDSAPQFLSHLALLPLVLSLWTFALASFGAYKSPRSTSRLKYAWSIARASAVALASLLSLLFLLKIQYVSRVVMVVFTAADFVALTGLRLGIVWFFQRSLALGECRRRVLIVGSGPRARRLAQMLHDSSEWGIRIVGHLDPDPSRIGQRVLDASVVAAVGDIGSVLKENVVDEVILAIPRTMYGEVDKIARACEEEGVKLSFMADVFEVQVARIRLVGVGSARLISLEPVAQEEWQLILKRALDIAVAALAIPLLLPVMAVIAVAIKLDSPGPLLFGQERVGLHKRRFRMLKLRTMVANAEKLQAQVEHLNEASGPIFKIANDPRITRVGRLLRRSSLDELPQIIHVLTGEMSLVGPRPMSLRDVDLFDNGIQRKRFSVKPGLTCLWQVSGRSQLPFSKWLELDLDYIERWSLALDLKILLRTLPAVVSGKGAL